MIENKIGDTIGVPASPKPQAPSGGESPLKILFGRPIGEAPIGKRLIGATPPQSSEQPAIPSTNVTKEADKKPATRRPNLVDQAIVFGIDIGRQIGRGRREQAVRAQQAATPPPDPVVQASVERAMARARQQEEARQRARLRDNYGDRARTDVAGLPSIIAKRSAIAALPLSEQEAAAQKEVQIALREANLIMRQREELFRKKEAATRRIADAGQGNTPNTKTWGLEQFTLPPRNSLREGLLHQAKARFLNWASGAQPGRTDDWVEVTPQGPIVHNPSDAVPDRPIPFAHLGQYDIDVKSIEALGGVNAIRTSRLQQQEFVAKLGRLVIKNRTTGETVTEVPMIDPEGFRRAIFQAAAEMVALATALPDVPPVPNIQDLLPDYRDEKAKTLDYELPPIFYQETGIPRATPNARDQGARDTNGEPPITVVVNMPAEAAPAPPAPQNGSRIIDGTFRVVDEPTPNERSHQEQWLNWMGVDTS